MADNYVFLKNLSGQVINPRTELGAIDMTTVNGVVVTANTIGIMNGYVESAYYMNMVSGTDAANQDSAYIEGGTMFTLIGGYTVTDEIPPAIDASHERIPSEYSVRSAIDALATLGPALTPGAGIQIETVPGQSGGILSVAEGNGINVNTAQTGGVSVKAGAGISVDSNGVSVNTATNNTFGGIAGATNGVTLVDGIAQVDAGNGLLIDAGKVVIDDASVETTLLDVRIDGASTVTPVNDQVVTPGNLRGALSVGQAVDVSCKPKYTGPAAPTVNGEALTDQNFIWTMDWSFTASSSTTVGMGFTSSSAYQFPKFAPGLKYLFILDIKNTGDNSVVMQNYMNGHDYTPGAVYGCIGDGSKTLNKNDSMHIAGVFSDLTSASIGLKFGVTSGAAYSFEITNWRQYEVTALTYEAIIYLAQMKNPDAFFRSSTIFQVRDKYLVKQDMVCPWIFTIKMDDNKDLTVAAGLSYKIRYTNDSPHKITVDTIPADAYGWDAHIQMFIKGTSSIVFQKPLILMDALTPNAGHNLLVKFRNGDAYVYVEDTNAGYIVTEPSGTGAGTLNFGIVDPETDYVIFAAALDGTTVDAGTAAFVGGSTITTLNILGNGTDATTITGDIGAASGMTINFQALAISGGTLSGAGTLNLDDVSVPSTLTRTDAGIMNLVNVQLGGSTINGTGTIKIPSGGSVTGSGLIDMEGHKLIVSATSGVASLTGVTITGATDTTGDPCIGYLKGGAVLNATSCVFSGCETMSSYFMQNGGTMNFTSCIFDTANKGALYNYNGSAGFVDCTFNGTGYACHTFQGSNYFEGCDIKGPVTVTGNAATVVAHTFAGSNSLHGTANTRPEYVFITVEPNSILDLTGNANNVPISATRGAGISIGSNFTVITSGGVSRTYDALTCTGLTKDGIPTGGVSLGDSDMWVASNGLFTEALDASAVAGTIKLSGTTFTSASKVLNANRIQLPAATTVSFSGNTNAANTKILEAPVMLVGDNATSPSGSATVVNAAGTASTVSGIGTYIDKEGDNDFVPLTSVSTVSTSATSGAGSLPAALTGSNKFVRLTNNVVGTVGAATDAVDKTVMTNEYDPIIGGTFSLTSATVNEATKTVAIQSGGTMSIVGIRGGKDSVIDLGYDDATQTGGTFILVPENTTASISGVTITNGRAHSAGGGVLASSYAGSATGIFVSCVFAGNKALAQYGNGGGACVQAPLGESVFSSCTFTGNNSYVGKGLSVAKGSATVIDCVFGDLQDLNLNAANTTSATLKGSNTIYKVGGYGKLNIASGAIIDLTGNTNDTPIAPGGGITFGANVTVINSAGSSVLLNGGEAGTCSVIKNDGTTA